MLYFPVKITKQYIEQHYTQEQLFLQFLKIEPKFKKMYSSPFRDEGRSSCSFYRNSKGELILKDFGSNESYNWVAAVMKLYNCNYYKALDYAAEDLRLVDNQSSKPIKIKTIKPIEKVETSSVIEVKLKQFSKEELLWWETFGISKKTLKLFNVYSIEVVFLNGEICQISSETNPIYGYFLGRRDGLDIWKIYLPKAKNKGYRFLTNARVNVVQGYKQLFKHDFLVITKALKDCMLLRELGIPAIAPNSETSFIPDDILELLQKNYKNIVIFFDNDYTGIKFLNIIRKEYPQLQYTFIPRKYGVKDISDFYKKFGKGETLKLINSYIYL